MMLTKRPFENIVGKGENAGKQLFFLFPQCFQPVRKQVSVFQSHLFCCLQMFSILTSLNTLSNNKIWALTKLKAFADNKLG